MSIFGRHDSTPAADDERPAPPQTGAHEHEPAEPAQQPQAAAGQPAPEFSRAQGEAPEPPGDVVVLDSDTAVKDPAPPRTGQAPGTAEPAAPGAAAEPAVTGEAAAPAAPGGSSPQRWSEILATFVDDPRGSVTMAAAAVDLAIEEHVDAIRAQQRALAARWQDDGTDTEQLRTVLRDYRAFARRVAQLGSAGQTGVPPGRPG